MKKTIVVALFAFLFTSFAIAQTKFVIATPGFDHPEALVLKTILPEAYKQLGYDVEFKILPPERAKVEVANGSADAFLFSDESMTTDVPGIVRVPTSIGSDDIVVFTKNANIAVKGWDSLKSYNIGYQIGMFIIEKNLKSGFKTLPAQNPPQVFQMLDAGRSDLVVMPLGVGLMMIKNLKLTGIVSKPPALVSVPLYHFLAAKNAAVSAKLDAVLAGMVKNGRIKAVTDSVYADFAK